MIRLEELRKQRNLSQKQIADILQITQQAYSNYENGKREPEYDMLIKISKFYETSVDYILGISGDPDSHDKKAPLKPEPDIKWGDFGISFYEGNGKKLTQKQKDKITKLVQIAVMDDDNYYWGEDEDENNKTEKKK